MGLRRGIRVFFTVLMVSLPWGGAIAAEPASDVAAESGHALATQWCASCHVVDPDRPGTDAVPTFRSIAGAPGVSRESLKGYLLKPHGQMPDFQLSFPHLDSIVAYILSLEP